MIGEFIVRDVASQPDSLGLSVKVGTQDLMNYLLQGREHGRSAGVTIRGTKEVFSTLSELIEHYSSRHRPALPCQLMERNRPYPSQSAGGAQRPGLPCRADIGIIIGTGRSGARPHVALPVLLPPAKCSGGAAASCDTQLNSSVAPLYLSPNHPPPTIYSAPVRAAPERALLPDGVARQRHAHPRPPTPLFHLALFFGRSQSAPGSPSRPWKTAW